VFGFILVCRELPEDFLNGFDEIGVSEVQNVHGNHVKYEEIKNQVLNLVLFYAYSQKVGEI
jgi:hypothetical protein